VNVFFLFSSFEASFVIEAIIGGLLFFLRAWSWGSTAAAVVAGGDSWMGL
jgi:hypothetical protein